jgi:hypothetical protein
MSQAAKLFDQQATEGNVSSGVSGADKQSAVMKAGEMALKMYVQSQSQGQHAGPGMSGLLGMAGKFLQ